MPGLCHSRRRPHKEPATRACGSPHSRSLFLGYLRRSTSQSRVGPPDGVMTQGKGVLHLVTWSNRYDRMGVFFGGHQKGKDSRHCESNEEVWLSWLSQGFPALELMVLIGEWSNEVLGTCFCFQQVCLRNNFRSRFQEHCPEWDASK